MFHRYDVLCVGSAAVDTYLTISQPFSSLRLGDKVLVTTQEKHSGGGATNAAAALSIMGLHVKILTKIGNDHGGEFIRQEMREYNAPNICRHTSTLPTDSATLISMVSGDRIIFVHKGASEDLSPHDYRKRDLHTKWFYLATGLGKTFTTEKQLADYARKKHINVLFNPSLYLAQKGKRYLQEVLRATTLLVLNKEEAQALLGTTSLPITIMVRQLQLLGPPMVVITNGRKKMYGSDGKNIYVLLPPTVPRVHTAGAGDAFTSGLLAGLIKGYAFRDALALGQANASSLIQHIGTKTGLLTEQEAQRVIKKLRIKVRIL